MNIVANFLLALVGTLFVSGIAKWIAGMLTQADTRVAAFCVACGYAAGKYSFAKHAGADITINVAAGVGALVALALLWFLWFRRKDHATTD